MDSTESIPLIGFNELTPDVVLDLVEKGLGTATTSICRPLGSYINRVYETQLESGEWVVAKFYRPGRWSPAALKDEQDFVLELAERDVPVIAPLALKDGGTLGEHRGMYFALFPKRSGRSCDEPSDEQWEELGRLIARVHLVGEMHAPNDRIEMSPDNATTAQLEFILSSDVIPHNMRRDYEAAARNIIGQITPMFSGVEMIRIHGDCHKANIIHRPDEGFYLIDFDDMAVGPPVQDFWMLLPDYSRASLLEIDLFLEGYTTFRGFDRRMLKLIEPLRAMRYIHFTAWCVAQDRDGNFSRLVPGWGTDTYWSGATRDLRNQKDEIASLETFSWGQ